MVSFDLEELKNKIEIALESKLQDSIICSIEENTDNEIVVNIELEEFYYDWDKVELLRELVRKLGELGYEVDGTERVYWTAETTIDLLTGEIINEREAYSSDNYYIFNVRIWVNKDKLDKFEKDILEVINGLKVLEQKEE